MTVDDVALSIWAPIVSKQLKIEQILSLKTAHQRPLLKEFAKQYSEVMGEIHVGEVRLSELAQSSQAEIFGADDISTVLDTHKKTLVKEIESFSQDFENILNNTIENNSQDDIRSFISKSHKLILAAQVICWLRLVSVIHNPPPSSDKLYLLDSFAISARKKAQNSIAAHIALITTTLAKQLLSSRSWTGSIPEKCLWEG
jgi:hypothetical protein